MTLALAVLGGAILALVPPTLVIISHRRACQLNTMLRLKAEGLNAWPVAALRGGQHIVLDFRHHDPKSTPFIMLDGLQSKPISGDEIGRLWRRGRLRWYWAGQSQDDPIGLRHYLVYADERGPGAPRVNETLASDTRGN